MALSPDRWGIVERVYHAALARPDDERSRFVAEACSEDEELRCEVESLLQNTSSDTALTRAALVPAAALSSDAGEDIVGRRFGPYQMLASLGAGGMGEVYRARDTRLGRDVAIKILPRAYVTDPDRRARFEREARVLASLNHPHIAAIHGIEDATVGAGFPIRALVLELVEGDTLAERIARAGSTGLPIVEALDIARQMAEALDAAHEKGIVHRDLKPANIKITPQGVVKVLDFGLAKLEAGRTGTAGSSSEAPTLTVNDTREGLIVGTAAYMSPEQARGQAVDKRCDIWAFGCVLYEMLTGQQPFAGPTLSDTVAAILDREPEWDELPASTPAPVRTLLRRCLTKPLRQRLRDIGDAVLELESASNLDVPDASASSVRREDRTRVIMLSAIALGVVVAVVALLVIRSGLRSNTSPVALGPMTRLTSDAGLTTEPSVSADGRFVAYASNRSGDNLDIYVQQTSGGAAIRLTTDPADDRQPTLSPDGSFVAFRSDRTPAGIYLAPALGGSARLVGPDGRGPRFSPDGQLISYWTGPWLGLRTVGSDRRVFIIPAAGGAPTRLAAQLAGAGDPLWAPDGHSLLVFGRDAVNEPDWWRVPIDGGQPTKTGVYARLAARQLDVTTPDSAPLPQAWDMNGVLFSAIDRGGDTRTLWRIAIDARSGQISGEPVRLTHGTTSDVWPSVSQEGRVVFAAQTISQLIFGLPIDVNAGTVTGAIRRLRDDATDTGRASLSEDGRVMVFPKYEFASGGVWARDLSTGREWQLAATPRTPLNPVVTVDGRWTAYTISKTDTGGGGGPGDGYVVETAGGAPRKVCAQCQMDQWTQDGRFAVVSEAEHHRLDRLEIATGKRVPLLEGAAVIDRVQFEPTSRWMTFNVPGRVYVAPVHETGGSPQQEWMPLLETTGAGRTAGLSPDGSLLYALLETDGFRCLYGLRLDPKTGQRRGSPFLIAHFHDAARSWGSTGLGSAAVKGLFVADLFETSSNIWIAALDESSRR